jgi:hypothetical protein
MTESNKQRIVKYFNLISGGFIINDFNQANLSCITFGASVRCAIAEVEAVIEELKTRNLTYAYHEAELTELKAMLV